MPDGTVVLVEIERRTLSRVHADGKIEVIAQLGGGPNGAALGPDGAVYVCNNGGLRFHEDKHGLRPTAQADDYSGGRIERVDLKTGETRVLYRDGGNGPLRGPNDIVFDRAGGMWFTDLGKTRARDMDRGGVYYAAADGSSIREAIYPMLTPNGIGLSPDEKRLYVAETHTGRLWGFDLEAPGLVKRRGFPSPNGGELIAGLPGYQLFDSLRGRRRRKHLRRHALQRRHHGDLARRQADRAHAAARRLHDEHLLRRQGPAHCLRDAERSGRWSRSIGRARGCGSTSSQGACRTKRTLLAGVVRHSLVR
jgi:hypothetical protein